MNSNLTPILLLIYNRPNITKKAFEEIRKQKPKFLYIAADGPKKDKIDDYIKCKITREIVTDLDWDCELKTLFRKKNLGSKYAVSSAITWFFNHVEEGIILEDDCIPNQAFFQFSTELLTKYKHDEKVMHISGSNLDDSIKFGNGSYYYSRYANTWGWATWKRAWSKYDLELNDQKLYSKLIAASFKYHSERIYWNSIIELLKSNKVDAWDYQWLFSIWREKGICLNCNYNLVKNIGFGLEATHTTGKSVYVDSTTKCLVKIEHPASSQIIEDAERKFINIAYGLQRTSYISYWFQMYILQRFYNLIHKIGFLRSSK